MCDQGAKPLCDQGGKHLSQVDGLTKALSGVGMGP